MNFLQIGCIMQLILYIHLHYATKIRINKLKLNIRMIEFKLESAPSQHGRMAIVTGANTGLGYETALGLASKGAKVIMACRSEERGMKAVENILLEVPQGDLELMTLDLNSLNSVRSFAEEFKSKYDQLHILINNAGIMVPPFSKTEDGFESQFGVNYLSHFLLTGLLFPILNRSKDSRVISLSSLAHNSAKIDFNNLNAQKGYSKNKAYGQSKLACLMFAYELDRRLRASKSHIISVAAHPGGAVTNLSKHMSPMMKFFVIPIFRVMSHDAKNAALTTLMGAIDGETKGGEYIGPIGFGGLKGEPRKVKSKPQSYDIEVAKKLWEVSEELLNFKFDV
jgi:NAD(P)-dependent dehydrogenase (short-subunit alcohol dehydrogenase family)